MANQIYSIPEIRNILMPIFNQYEIKKAILFGSYGKGSATENSDVDLLVDSGLRGLKFLGLSEAIRQTLDKEVDVFDTTHIEPHSLIEREIQSTGVTLYEE